MGMMEDESLMNQWMKMMNWCEDLSAELPPATASAAAFSGDDHLQHYSFLHDHPQQPPAERPAKQLRASSWGSSCVLEPTPSPETQKNFSPSQDQSTATAAAAAAASFSYPANPPPQFTILDYPIGNNENIYVSGHRGAKRKVASAISSSTAKRSSSSGGAQDHVVAERRRRENLTQLFIALSALVPSLKKMDKASVLAEAIKYLKQLQERVKALEDQIRCNQATESVVALKKSNLVVGDTPGGRLPEIEARVCERNVLIRIIHCDKNKKGLIEKTLSEVAKLRLGVVSSSVLAFGRSALHMTIVAQMDAGCCKTAEELVKTLRAAFMDFI